MRLGTSAAGPVVMLIALGTLPFATARPPKSAHPLNYTFEIVRSFPHDVTAFTQGLAYHDGFLYEGTGLSGRSSLRKVRLETGEVLQKLALPAEFFGEGITIFDHEVIQLTWQSQIGFVYRLNDFHRLSQFQYSGEGWGLTTDGRNLYMSDGSSEIRVLDPRRLQATRRLNVRDGAEPVQRLNELEFVEGEIFANVWQTDKIARISPATSKVVGWIDLTGILGPMYRRAPDAVLNGIAYDPGAKRLFVTGKLWPKVFQIRLVRKR
ncbi:MAG TPA: glutaminyl-peptide cyclotransferase [Terriglobales bacterium]|nr:glutaminyl-peptide cyclotransferase [Terriglobales bacterium]